MNRLNSSVITALFALALMVGCGSKSNTQADTQALEKNFANAEPALKAFVDRAVAAAKTSDYNTVVSELSRIANNEKLTPEQQKAVKEVMASAQKIVVASPPKNVDRLPMALPK